MLRFDSEIRDQAYQFFIQEAVDFLQILETGLLDLSQDHSTAKVHELMRAAHSIKGGAASVGLNTIKQLAYQLEDCLRALYQDTVVIDTTLEDLLLQAFDCLQKPLMQQIETGEHDEATALAAAETVYIDLVEHLGEALQQVEADVPTAAELGIDIVQAIFEGDVQNGIERIERVVAQPDSAELVGEIRAQAEVFVGVGELVNLPGWVAIAKAILAAIQQAPKQAQAIGTIAIADLKAARQRVLEGDRCQGGEPSAALLQYGTATTPEITADPELTESIVTEFIPSNANDPDAAPAPIDETINEANIAAAPTVIDRLTMTDVDMIPFEAMPPEQIDELFGLAMMSLDDDTHTEPLNPATPESLAAALETLVDGEQTLIDHDLMRDSVVEPFTTPDLTDLDTFFDVQRPTEQTDDRAPQANDWLNAQTADSAPSSSTNTAPDDSATISAADVAIPLPAPTTASTAAMAVEAYIPKTTDAAAASNHFTSDLLAAENQDDWLAAIEPEITAAESSWLADELENLIITAIDLPTDDALTADVPDLDLLPIPLPANASVETTIHNLLDNADRGVYRHLNAPRLQGLNTRTVLRPIDPKIANANQVVRVDLVRLERINNLVSAMVTQENSTMRHNQQLQATTKVMLKRFQKFESIARQIGAWSDQSQKLRATLDRQQSAVAQTGAPVENSWQADFDPLQMDAYGELYGFAQELLEMMAQIGEGMHDIDQLSQQAVRSQQQQQHLLKQIRDDLHWARMLPFGDLLKRFPRMMRDLSNRYGKPVKLELLGTNTLVDKSILQNLYDPLVHLLRNAFDHGIELPEERLAQGKPAQATIGIKAYHRGNQTYIEITDDGGGIDPERLRRKLIDHGHLSAEAAQALKPEQLYDYLFTAGFSTAGKVSELSGRGVGLDAVRSQVAHLKGSVSVTSNLGEGTKFTLKLPLTLTVANLLVFTVQTCMIAVPIDALKAIISVPQRQIQMHQGQKVYYWQDEPVPLCPRSQLVQAYPLPRQLPTEFKGMSLPKEGVITLLLVETAEQQTIAVAADQIVQEQELAIKPFGQAIKAPAHFSGCTIMGNGLLVPVLDVQSLTSSSSQTHPPIMDEAKTFASIRDNSNPTGVAIDRRPVVLVVDDSLTARQTLTFTLQDAGYRVLQAKNGREGLEQVARDPDIQVVFSDVEMPQMNGFEFLSQCRKTYTKEQLPIIMLTSRGGDKHRQIAQYMGANDYLTKPYLAADIFRSLEDVLPQRSQ